MGLTNSESWLMSWQINEKFDFPGLSPRSWQFSSLFFAFEYITANPINGISRVDDNATIPEAIYNLSDCSLVRVFRIYFQKHGILLVYLP